MRETLSRRNIKAREASQDKERTCPLHSARQYDQSERGSDRERYIESLEMIRGPDFDLIVRGIAAAGQPCYEVVEWAWAERRIDEILE
jgi:hypothetical protein